MVNEQTSQIERIGITINETDGELSRAKRILAKMFRRIITDKILWTFVILIIIAVVLVILMETGVIHYHLRRFGGQNNNNP